MSEFREIERKFLVEAPPSGWRHYPHSKIDQGYFPMKGRDVQIRLRRVDSQYYLTIKSGQGQSRYEEEIELPHDRFTRLWCLTSGARISKTRYKIPFEGRTIEMDVYSGRHTGLITAEIEFSSLRESRSFEFPEWFGREVTGEPRYTNAFLARTRHGRSATAAARKKEVVQAS